MFEEDSNRTSSIGDSGRRRWLYPLELSGRFKKNRRAVAYILFCIAALMPWLSIDGHPLIKFDPFEFKMFIFGKVFWPQELKLFFPFVLGVVLFIFTITATFGRIWCGWACPQTVFLHFFYGDIERLVEGKAAKRKKRDFGSISLDWIVRKIVKHLLFLLLSVGIGNLFLTYFLGPTEVLLAMQQSPSANPFAFKVMIFISLFFYANFAFAKEIMCTIACPYARFQSVLTDTRSMVISYDHVRGEPRSVKGSKDEEKNGDCVNCKKCVKVCPTGIDIRNGQQLECVGCALCIDACDSTMDQQNLERGLIRYASEKQIHYSQSKVVGSRFVIYSAITLICFIIFFTLLNTRSLLQINLTKVQSVPYIVEEDGEVRNMFTLRLRNKSYKSMSVTIEPNAASVRTNWSGSSITVPAGERRELTFLTWIPRDQFVSGHNETIFSITTDGIIEYIPVMSVGPK
ncbi:MAG: cytochrome c oxidase accessory protein CcoG [Fibrobacterales bacterium]